MENQRIFQKALKKISLINFKVFHVTIGINAVQLVVNDHNHARKGSLN